MQNKSNAKSCKMAQTIIIMEKYYEVANEILRLAKSVVGDELIEDNDTQDCFVKHMQDACTILLHEAADKHIYSVLNE